jgi:sec-independent protein translocase protein TatA
MRFRIEPLDIVLILIVAFLFFGPSRLPEIGRGIGKAISEFRRGTKDMVEGFTDEITRPTDEGRASPPEPTGNLCAQYRAANVSDARFCNKCGAWLVDEPGSA